MFKIVCLLAMVMHVAFGGMFSVPSPLVVPSVQKMQQGRRDLSSIDVCTVDTCGFDGSSFEKIRRIRQSFDANDPEIVMYWSFVGEDKVSSFFRTRPRARAHSPPTSDSYRCRRDKCQRMVLHRNVR